MTTPRSRMMAILTVVAMLAVGIAAGIGIERKLLHRRGDDRGGARRGGGGGGGPFGMISEHVDTASRNRMRARIVKRITDDLSLTPTQAVAVDKLFARRELQLDSIRGHVGPQLDSLRDQMRIAFDSILTPEQRVKSAATRKRMEDRRKADSASSDGPGPRS